MRRGGGDVMTYALGALILCIALLKMELSVGTYLAVEGCAVYQMMKLDMEM